MSFSAYSLYGPPKVGGDTLAYCTRCKEDRGHVIAAMVDGRPVRVICKSCQSQHNYKAGKGARDASPREKRVRVTTPKVVQDAPFEVWEKRMRSAGGKPTRNYTVATSFELGDIVQHAQFGLGFVEEVKKGGKIRVVFRTEEKILVHGLTP